MTITVTGGSAASFNGWRLFGAMVRRIAVLPAAWVGLVSKKPTEREGETKEGAWKSYKDAAC